MTTIYRKKGNPEFLLKAYDATLRLWNVPVEAHYVSSSFGIIHVLVTGPENGEPLVLLHGFGFSSTVWLENIQALSKSHRVYAVDFPGDINKSEATRPIRNKEDCATWYTELLNGLNLSKAHIAGHSYGGFIAMLLAARIPDRIGKLIVLSPGGAILPQSKRFFFRCMLAGMMPSTKRINALMDYMTGKGNTINQTVKDQFITAMQNALPRHHLFASFMKDAELQKITVPTLLLIGDQEVQYDAEQAVRRAKEVLSGVEAHVVRDAGHGLPLEKPEIVNSLMLEFLGA